MSTYVQTRLADAMNARAAMLTEGLVSRPQTEQRMAVVTSLAMNQVELAGPEADAILTEGAAILQGCWREGIAAEDVAHASVSDLVTILTDPTITDICLIGEGSIGNLYVREYKNNPQSGLAFDWHDVVRHVDHLKTGYIYQRMCSGLGFAAIPWGTFAAADIRKILISDKEEFLPEQHDRPQQGLSPAFDNEELTHDALYRLKMRLRDRRMPRINKMSSSPDLTLT